MTAAGTTAVGSITLFPAYLGAEPWAASKMATAFPMFADGAKPSPPTGAEVRSLMSRSCSWSR